MASMADSIEPYAVRTITSILGRNSFTFSRREIPPIPGMRTSVTSTSTGFLFIYSRASSAVGAVPTSPISLSTRTRPFTISGSSSTTKILGLLILFYTYSMTIKIHFSQAKACGYFPSTPGGMTAKRRSRQVHQRQVPQARLALHYFQLQRLSALTIEFPSLANSPLTGKTTVKRLPLPTSLSTCIKPPCLSTMFLHVESPSPVPAPSGFVEKKG